MFAQHYPALIVVLPLMAAPLAVMFGSRQFAWWLAFLGSIACTIMGVSLLLTVSGGEVLSYHLGDWPPPWGIELKVDMLNALILTLVSGMSTVVLPFALRTVPDEVADDRIYLFYGSWLLCLCGLLGMTVTGDAFNVFVFLEISSLSTYVLISLAKRRQALVAAFRYLIMGTLGATFILIGIGLLYMMTGTLNMADMAERVQAVNNLAPVHAGVAFIVVGIMLKMALFPLHMWLPGAYGEAPMAVTAFLAGTATKVAVYLLIRFGFSVFGVALLYEQTQFGLSLAILGGLAAVAGSVLALTQADAKKLFAYSSVAQIGYMALGVGVGLAAAVAGAILHLVNHALMKSALFMALGAVRTRGGGAGIEALDGAGRRMPITMVCFTIAGLSLIGVPLTAGFISKWYLIVGTFERGWWALAAITIITSLMAAVYVGRLLERVWMRAPGEHSPTGEAHFAVWAPLAVLGVANIYFGVDTAYTGHIAVAAAQALGVTP